ncbi:MAG: T9SS type A sorting domain-containing protein [Paludibacteraceae bacterium]|nr:T9SS type A sorting domain-containing protein [Paludibacteraceae bacterium]
MNFLLKKGLLICSTLLLHSFNGFSQSSVVASGGSTKTNEGSISISVGQVDYTNTSTENLSINAGVQQPTIERHEQTNKSEVNNHLIKIKAYPNPTPDVFSVFIENDENWYSFVLTNVEGELIYQGELKNNTNLSLGNQPIGAYLLKIYTDNRKKEFITIKIIKE